MASSQILRSTGATVEVTFYADGVATDADAAVTATVLKADGTTLSTGAATSAGASSGKYRYVIQPQANLNSLTITWTGAFSGTSQTLTTTAEIVGSFLFSEAQARAYNNAVMASTTTYPSAAIVDTRAQITDALESYTGLSWTPRFKRRALKATGDGTMEVPERKLSKLVSATSNGTALSGSDLTSIVLDEEQGLIMKQAGAIWIAGGTNPRPIVLEYEYGYDRPVDGVDRIALKWLRRLLVASDIYETASSYSTDLGTFTTAPFLPSGDREVDNWVRSHTMGIY